MKEKSNVGLILGIIGGVLLIPGMFCVACMGGLADAGAGGTGEDGVMAGYLIGIVGIVFSFIGAGLSKSKGTVAGILLIVATLFALIGLFMTVFTSIFHWAAVILLIIGSVSAFKNK